MKLIIALFVTLFALTACHGSARVDGPGYDIKVESDDHYDGHHSHPHKGRFCPPGQAKKGRCH